MSSAKMPVLFLGHGSPMNALADNAFTKSIAKLALEIPTPKSILTISAHWQTDGTYITSTDKPRLIYDMSGFPEELYQVKYPAVGDSVLAERLHKKFKDPVIGKDEGQWGLDHGTWSVLKHLYPKADIPVLQLSMDHSKPVSFHYEMGKKLNELRSQGVLILGSGNIVHNLRKINWQNPESAFDWNIEFDQWAERQILDRNHSALINDFHKSEAGKLSIPTLEHYLPLLYVLGASEKGDEIKFDIKGYELGSLSQRSVRLG